VSGANGGKGRVTRRRPVAVDLFAGAGGLSLGFEQAGFDVAAAVEIDPIHAATHRYNFPDCATIPKPIAEVSGRELRSVSGIGDREVDIVVGGPPCQGFSLIGQRMLDDPRNALVKEFLRLVVELSPAFFLFENVKGLTVGRHRRFLRELAAALQAAGYRVLMPWRVLNAANYGVPQDRARLFLIGARGGRQPPRYPPSLTAPRGQGGAPGLPAPPTCEEALGDLPEAERYQELSAGDAVRVGALSAVRRKRLCGYAAELRCLCRGSWHYGYGRRWDPELLTASARTAHTDISRRCFARTAPGAVEPVSRFFKLAADGLSNTLRAGTDSARGAFTSPRPIHYARDRCVTIREMARLHGFPDWFRFHKTKWHGARQVGNAVPPPLARALAFEFLAAMGVSPARPRRALPLGDAGLLGMDMTAAADYWGVAVPIARRDRKSGARKRKQQEIEEALERGGTEAKHG